MDVYILPKHVWGPLSADEREKYDGITEVGSGPFVLEKFEKGQFARFRANPNFWGGKPAVDKVVLRKFNNPDAMVAALKTGELDAATDLATSGFKAAREGREHRHGRGLPGAMDEIALNGGDGLKKPHPALLDPKVREAIGHAIDRETIVDRVLEGLGQAGRDAQRLARPEVDPGSAPRAIFDFDLDKAKAILDEAGYMDTDGDGVREMPDGGQPLNFKYMVRADSVSRSRSQSSLRAGCARSASRPPGGSPTRASSPPSSARATTTCSPGAGLPFVDPDPMLSYFTCDQIASDPEDPTNYYNDANYCDPGYDRLYEEQKVELDDERRVEIVHEMLLRKRSGASTTRSTPTPTCRPT